MSSRRSRRGGSSISTVFSRNSRSWRKRLSSASCSDGQLVAAITRTSIGTGLLAPTGTTWRCSSAVSSLGWRWSGRLPISSRNRRAAVGRLHPPDPVGAGVGEGALHMAEQLAFEQILGDRAEIDRDQDLVGAARPAVELARDQLLAGAVLAEDQDVGVGRRRPARSATRPAPSPASGRAGASRRRPTGAGDRRDPLALGHRFLARGAQRGGGADGGEQPLVRPGLGDEVGGAALHRLDRDCRSPAWAVIITTTACGSRFSISASQWKPSAALVAPRPKLASSRMTSGSSCVHRRQRLVGRLEGGDLGEQVAQQQPRRQQDVRIVVDDDAAPEAPCLVHWGALPCTVR